MRSFRALAVLTAPLLLSACYTSTKPLIQGSQAVFPYQTIVYTQQGDTSGTQQTLTHTGNAYVAIDNQGNMSDMVFMPVQGQPNYYVTQLHLKMDSGADGYLYGLIKVDLTAKTASAYAIVAEMADIGPGLPACADSPSTVCMTDIAPYITHALAIAKAAAAPDTIYNLVSLK